ncbi:MAG: amidohydrolase family protein [Rhodobacteraceae bacterium]|nr:amidohydrolase family protein [Paracoccaceae bacterium]
MKVIDVDAHGIEPASVWDYLAKSDEQYRPSILRKERGSAIQTHFSGPSTKEYWVIDNYLYGKHDPDAIAEASKGEISIGALTLDDIGARLANMDTQQVDVQIVYSSIFLNIRIARKEAELALTRAYNRWVAERCSGSNGRLRWAFVPSLKNPQATAEDMKWARDNGAAGVLFRGIEGNQFLDHQDFDPVYAKAAELDLPICVHIGHGCPAFETIAQRDNTAFNRFVSDSPNYFAFSMLLRSQVAKMFPQLRFGFFESGSSWVFSAVQTAMHVRLQPPDLMALVQEKLRKHNFYITCELHEDLPTIIKYTGTDNLIMGSDYGHPHDIADTIYYRQSLAKRADIDDNFKQKVVRENCNALFHL